jgi:hypothetical protein
VPEALPIPLIGLMKAKFPQEGGHCLAYCLGSAKVPQGWRWIGTLANLNPEDSA